MKIFWEELYDEDVVVREEEEEEEEEEEIFVEAEKNPLHKLLKDMEERMENKMSENFVKVKRKVSTLQQKLRTIRKTMNDLQTKVDTLKTQAWRQEETNGDVEKKNVTKNVTKQRTPRKKRIIEPSQFKKEPYTAEEKAKKKNKVGAEAEVGNKKAKKVKAEMDVGKKRERKAKPEGRKTWQRTKK